MQEKVSRFSANVVSGTYSELETAIEQMVDELRVMNGEVSAE